MDQELINKYLFTSLLAKYIPGNIDNKYWLPKELWMIILGYIKATIDEYYESQRKLKIYALNYNILRIMSGSVALSYTT